MGIDAPAGSGARRRDDLPPNHPGVYDRYQDEWWRSRGPFAALQWLARSRARLLPPPSPGALLVDVGCGAGLLGPHVGGYRYIGFDISHSALLEARRRGVTAVRADVTALPVRTGAASVVVAGEIFEHVDDLGGCLDEIARVMEPGATLVFDTINDTRLARLLLIGIGDRIPAGPPPILHDPSQFIPPAVLHKELAHRGIEVEWWGLRPSLPGYLGYLLGRDAPVKLVRSRLEAVLYQGIGRRR